MSDIMTCVLVGNLTRDPELKHTAGGVAVAEFGIACNKARRLPNGEWENTPHFFDVAVWEGQADNVVASLHRGDRVMIQGELRYSQWEDKETGKKRNKVTVNATNIGPALRWARVPKIDRAEKGGGAVAAERPVGGTVDWDDAETEPF